MSNPIRYVFCDRPILLVSGSVSIACLAALSPVGAAACAAFALLSSAYCAKNAETPVERSSQPTYIGYVQHPDQTITHYYHYYHYLRHNSDG